MTRNFPYDNRAMNILSKIRIILVHNSHPGNIGASARALKNMGLSQLCLVKPREFPSKEAEAMASNAQDILEETQVFATLDEALTGCTWVLGCSARERKLSLPIFSAREASGKIRDQLINTKFSGEIAILFGNEQHGLSNEELDKCHAQILIPTAAQYASLNLAQAVQIIAYELFLAFINTKLHDDEMHNKTKSMQDIKDLPSYESLAEFYSELEKTLIQIQFLDPQKPGHMMTRFKQLFARAGLDKTELTLLRGMLTALQKNKKVD